MILFKNLKKIKTYVAIAAGINLVHTVYVFLRASYLNTQIPFWYSFPWGESQLAQKEAIYLLPILAWLVLVFGVLIALGAMQYHIRYGKETISLLVIAFCITLFMSSVRIIFVASLPFEPLINPLLLKMVFLLLTTALLSILISRKVIDLMVDNGIVTDPGRHKHPGMVLIKPSARGGGLIFAFSFVLMTLLFVPMNKFVFVLILAVIISSLLGLADDVQNTKPNTPLKFLENPIIRLCAQIVIAGFIAFSGFTIDFVSNPFDGVLFLNNANITLLGLTFAPLSILITILWLTWMMNMLSWSNAIDGQYSGVMGIASIALVVLTLRPGFDNSILAKDTLATLAIIMAGASLGILPFNWHPSKIMWGFGAISIGLLFATLSIATRAKVPASIFVILIPFMDGVVTLLRRVLQGKFPLKADKGHLHHLLLDRGWGIKKIAIFYWVTTALFAVVAIMIADRNLPTLMLTGGGIVAFLIIIVNLQAKRLKLKQQQAE